MHIINYDNPPPIEELRVNALSGDGKLDNGRYSWEKKYSVVAIYMSCGSMRETENRTGVAVPTLENWRKMPWWDKMVQDIKVAESTQLNSKLNQIINKALGIIEDRLLNGETVVTRDGKEHQIPVSIRDATRAASELLNRKAQIEKNSVENVVRQATVQETLKALALEFAKMAKQNQPIILEESDDAIYKERT
jgi:hypothetical protein